MPSFSQPRARLVHQLAQRVDVEPVQRERVAGVVADDGVRTQHGARAADEDGQLVGGASRRVGVRPEDVDQRVGAHRPATLDGEAADEQPGLGAAEGGQVDAIDGEPTEQSDPYPTAAVSR